jgi:hypothetical protein
MIKETFKITQLFMVLCLNFAITGLWQLQQLAEASDNTMERYSADQDNIGYIMLGKMALHRSSLSTSVLNLVVCILLRVLDQVQGFCLTQHCFNSCLLFYSNYPLHVSVVRPSPGADIYIGN